MQVKNIDYDMQWRSQDSGSGGASFLFNKKNVR